MDGVVDSRITGKNSLFPIAHIVSPYDSKFGVPRQPGLVEVECRVVFEPPYRVAEAVRGLEEFDYVWLLWDFHLANRDGWSPTVRPPRLGGNRRVGVFATRSPFRPNSIGLSAVRLLRIEKGPELVVAGADLVSGTPIFDIKPYVAYTDAHPEARCGFATAAPTEHLVVDDPGGLLLPLAPALRTALTETMAQDPRPRYQDDPERRYVMPFAGYEVSFRVGDGRLVVERLEKKF